MAASRRLVTALLRDRRGNALVVMIAALPLVIAAAGFGIDTITLELARRQLQREADSAALAGAYALYQGKSASSAASRAVALNNLVALSATPTVVQESYSNAGGQTFSPTVHVTLTMNQ